jgi:hypothetical protein
LDEVKVDGTAGLISPGKGAISIFEAAGEMRETVPAARRILINANIPILTIKGPRGQVAECVDRATFDRWRNGDAFTRNLVAIANAVTQADDLRKQIGDIQRALTRLAEERAAAASIPDGEASTPTAEPIAAPEPAPQAGRARK